MNRRIRLRPIDRWIIGLLAALVAASGLYLVGPWYLETKPDGDPNPVFYLVNNVYVVKGIGAGMIIAAGFMGWAARAGVARVKVLSSALFAAFLLRLFTLMGTLLTIESWRPPGYLSPLFTVLLSGALWVWVKVGDHEGTTR